MGGGPTPGPGLPAVLWSSGGTRTGGRSSSGMTAVRTGGVAKPGWAGGAVSGESPGEGDLPAGNIRLGADFTGFSEAVVAHVETTGMDPRTDRIIEVALVRYDFSKVPSRIRKFKSGRFQGAILVTKVDPGVPVPVEAARMRGIDVGDLRGTPTFGDVAEWLRSSIGDLPVIGHNVEFHVGFLDTEFRRAGVDGLGRNAAFCTMDRTVRYMRETFPSRGDSPLREFGNGEAVPKGFLNCALHIVGVAGFFCKLDRGGCRPGKYFGWKDTKKWLKKAAKDDDDDGGLGGYGGVHPYFSRSGSDWDPDEEFVMAPPAQERPPNSFRELDSKHPDRTGPGRAGSGSGCGCVVVLAGVAVLVTLAGVVGVVA